MGPALIGLGGLLSLAGLVAWIIVLVDAFKHEIWKGIVGLLCGFYLLYYAIAEFQHEKKWAIVLTGLLGGCVGGALTQAGLVMMQRLAH